MVSNRWSNLWRDRRTLWLLLLTLVLIAGAALWTVLDYGRLVATMTIEAEQRITQLAAVRIRDELADFSNALGTLARSAEIAGGDADRQRAALARAAPIREGLFDAGIVVLDRFGVVTAVEPLRSEIVQQDWSGRPYFRVLLNSSPSSVVFSNAVGDGPVGSPVIVVGVPIIDGEGSFGGALAGMLRLSQSAVSPYYATLVKLRISAGGTAYVVDGSSRILFDSASLHDGEQYTNHQLPASGAADAPESLRTRDETGRELLISHAPIPGTPWTLVIENNWESLVAPTRTQVNLLLALLGLGTVLPLAALVMSLRQGPGGRSSYGGIGRESHLARQIDQALQSEPPPLLPGWEIAVGREPAPVTGRVFYDLLLGADGCLTLLIAETGRGETGSSAGAGDVLAMVTVRTLLRGAARSLLASAEALARTNQLLCPELPPGDFVICVYCRLEPVGGAVTLANAGQVRPLRVTAGEAVSLGREDAPLSMRMDTAYGEWTSVLAAGDCLLLCSSEVIHAQNGEGEEFGTTRLLQALAAPPAAEGAACPLTAAECIAAVTAALRDFGGGKWANDRDAILIAAARQP